jgi:hypothetical protein
VSKNDVWLWGALGGLLPIIARIAKSGTSDDVPSFWHWWLLPAALACAFLGGLVASLLDLQKASELTGFSQKLTVVLIGYSAPNIIANLAGVAGNKIARPVATTTVATTTPKFVRFLRA